MSGIFPNADDGGVAPALATNGLLPSPLPANTTCLYYGNGCDVRLRPEVINSIISEIMCVIDTADIAYRSNYLCNLRDAILFLISVCVQVNGNQVGCQKTTNFIAGSGVTISGTNDTVNKRNNVVISAVAQPLSIRVAYNQIANRSCINFVAGAGIVLSGWDDGCGNIQIGLAPVSPSGPPPGTIIARARIVNYSFMYNNGFTGLSAPAGVGRLSFPPQSVQPYAFITPASLGGKCINHCIQTITTSYLEYVQYGAGYTYGSEGGSGGVTPGPSDQYPHDFWIVVLI